MTSPSDVLGAEQYELRRSELGLDDPLPVQFGAWARELASGNLGYSVRRHVPVLDLIVPRAGPSFVLMAAGVSAALVVGVATGVFAALRQNTWVDYLMSSSSLIAVSIPNFFLGLASIFVFALWLGWLPAGGMRTLGSAESIGDAARHLALPASVLAINLIGPYVRYTRQGMLEVLRQDYITTAHAKGVSYLGVVVSHALRNAINPLVTVIAIQIPKLLAGTVVIETVFNWPGLGRLVFEAITGRDYPLVSAIILLTAVLVAVFNLLADLVSAILDPRIRL
jgi:peptide/nickel transport system permease protein